MSTEEMMKRSKESNLNIAHMLMREREKMVKKKEEKLNEISKKYDKEIEMIEKRICSFFVFAYYGYDCFVKTDEGGAE